VNRDEAKQILLLYRPGTLDGEDPDTAAALALAKADPELLRWLEEHCARQNALREKFRQIPVLAGLKEQIISEEAAKSKAVSRRQKLVGVAAVMAVIVALGVIVSTILPHKPKPADHLADYEVQMAYQALNNYAMGLTTNDAGQIQGYLAQNHAPSDYVLPEGLQKVAMTGCAIENWQAAKAAMICFNTGKLPQGGQHSDLWLFVVDRTTIKDASTITVPKFDKVGSLMTVAWTQGNNLYLLGAQSDEETLKKFL
jgi:hypothetical protein